MLKGDAGESLRDAVPDRPYSLALTDSGSGRLHRRRVGLEGAPMTLPEMVERLRCNGVRERCCNGVREREEHIRSRNMALSESTKQTPASLFLQSLPTY